MLFEHIPSNVKLIQESQNASGTFAKKLNFQFFPNSVVSINRVYIEYRSSVEVIIFKYVLYHEGRNFSTGGQYSGA